MICEFCATNTGRFIAGRPCCELRQIAQMPPVQVKKIIVEYMQQHGEAAAADYRETLLLEYARLQALRRRRQEDKE